MLTFILVAFCSIIGGFIGNYAFDGAQILGAVCGALVGLALRFGGAGAVDNLGDCFD